MATWALLKQNTSESKCEGMQCCMCEDYKVSPPRQEGRRGCQGSALSSRTFCGPCAISEDLEGRFCTSSCCAGAQLECSRHSPLSLGFLSSRGQSVHNPPQDPWHINRNQRRNQHPGPCSMLSQWASKITVMATTFKCLVHQACARCLIRLISSIPQTITENRDYNPISLMGK